MDAIHAKDKDNNDLQSFLTITLEVEQGDIGNDLVLKAIDSVSNKSVDEEEEGKQHCVGRKASQKNVAVPLTIDGKSGEGRIDHNQSQSSHPDVSRSKQLLEKRQYEWKETKCSLKTQDREERNEEAKNDSCQQERTIKKEDSNLTEHHTNDSIHPEEYQHALSLNVKKEDDEATIFDKGDRKRTRKQQIPRRLMKIIPLDSGVGATSGNSIRSPSEFRLFTGDRSFKLTALRDGSNPNAPAPYLKVYHAQVEELKWRCNECGKEFAMKETLEKHKAAIHEGNAPFKCQTCNKGFILEQSYYAHLYVHTGKRQFECEKCGKSFARKDTLTMHLKSHDIEPVYKCQYCDKQFTTSSTIIKHEVLVHNRESKHSCDICGKFLPTPSLLQVHLRKHTGEKPFECDSCDKKFKSLSEIKAHQISLHGGITKHACETCGKRFPKPSKLRIHERTHTGEKPYSCPECGKDFNVQGNLQKHIKIHKIQEISMAETSQDGTRAEIMDSHAIPGPSMFHM